MAKFTLDAFKEIFDELDMDTKVRLWNEYAINKNPDEEIFENGEEFFDEFFTSPSEAVRATYFGHYQWSDTYVWFNGYANLDSSDFPDDELIDVDTLYEFFLENMDILQDYEEFEEFFNDDDDDDDDGEAYKWVKPDND